MAKVKKAKKMIPMTHEQRQRQTDAQRTRYEKNIIRAALNHARLSGPKSQYKKLLNIEIARQWADFDGRLWTPPSAQETKERHKRGNEQRAAALAKRRASDAKKAKAAKAAKIARYKDRMVTYNQQLLSWKRIMTTYNAARKPYLDWRRKRRALSVRSSELRKLAYTETREYFVARRRARKEFRKAKIWPYVLPTRADFGVHLKELNKVQNQLHKMGNTEYRRLYAEFKSVKYTSKPRKPRNPR